MDQIFYNILNILKSDKTNTAWRDIDTFIENAFVKEVNKNFKTKFLRFLRNRLE